MHEWGVFGYLLGDPLPIVLGPSRRACLNRLREALRETPHPIGDLMPLHHRQFIWVSGEVGEWAYRGDVEFREFVARIDRFRPSRNGSR